jgi:hypothetical protein
MFDLDYSNWAQSRKIRDLESRSKRKGRSDRRARSRTATRIGQLEDDIGYLSLVLGALLQQMDVKGVISREDIQQAMTKLDSYDGEQDDKLDVDVLRSARAEVGSIDELEESPDGATSPGLDDPRDDG